MEFPTIPDAVYHSARIQLDPRWRYVINPATHEELDWFVRECNMISDLLWHQLSWKERRNYQRARKVAERILDNHIIDTETANMHRITERRAEALYNTGNEIRLLPSLMTPTGSWYTAGYKASRTETGMPFGEMVRRFRSGNCSAVNGYGVTFYEVEA